MSKYPESEKLVNTEIIYHFLEWLEDNGMTVAESVGLDLLPCNKNSVHLVHGFLGIDSAKLEAEREEMIADCRSILGE